MVEDAVTAVADLRGETGMIVSLLNLASGVFSDDVRLAIPALDSMGLVGESLLVVLEVRERLIVKRLLPDVTLFKDMDLVKLPFETADPVGVDNDKEVELTLVWPFSKCGSMLIIVLLAVTGSVVKLAFVNVEPVRLAS